ncbi:ABC transporter permease subunit [Salinibacterium sp.]|uniref:ABC transporter permease subunit n=1 Tax=Salinibacterium sp. TaxID=1915057 RepID=UPI00286D0D72|nr:branched-chain amino acid ABC transporter permease [Salinibacterium sp.]
MFVALLAALTFVGGGAAHADEINTDKYDYVFSGNVKYNGKPLEGVVLKVSGSGYSAEVKTGADGKWKIGVPEKTEYTVTLDESTLPKGVIVAEGGAEVKAKFGLTSSKSVNFFLGEGVRVTTSFFDQFIGRVFNGLSFGLLLALAAIGLSLIFGTTGLNNFAHAEMVTFGALATLSLAVDLAWPIWIAIIGALVLSGIFGFTLDAVLWRPLRKKGVGLIPMMIVSIGLSLAVRYTYQYIYGGGTRQLPGADGADLKFGAISLSPLDIASMVISIVVLLAVAYFLLRTRIGKATRAVSDNPSLASASGIDVDRVIRIVWIVGGVLAGLSGVLFAFYRPGVSWDMGFQILLLIFAAVTLGGLGTAFGALVGSLVVGMFVEVSTLFIPSDMKFVGALAILILVLLVRPQGILGRKERIG